jgi:hypothetical protein
MNNKKFLPYIIFGVPAIIGLYFVYKAISKPKGQDAPPNYDPNNNSNIDPKPNGGATPSVTKLFPLRKGSKGGKVIELQRAMLLYDDSILGTYRDDGDFGSTTEKALLTILNKKTADSQDDIDAIVKKANEKKKNAETQAQVDNTNNNRKILANKLIAKFKSSNYGNHFYAIRDTQAIQGKITSDGKVYDEKDTIVKAGEKLRLSMDTKFVVGFSGFIEAKDSYRDTYIYFSPYGFQVK